MKKPLVAATIIVLIGATACGAYLVTSKRKPIKRDENKYRLQGYGMLPDLPGPYLTRGKTSDLKLKMTDLGIASNAEFDPQGNLNFDSFGHKITTTRSKDADGMDIDKVVIPEAKHVQITTSGLEIDRPAPAIGGYTISKIVNGEELLKNGKPFYRQPNTDFHSQTDIYVQEGSMFFSPELVTNTRRGLHTFLNSEGKPEELPPEVGASLEPVGSSPELGTVCTVVRKEDDVTEYLYLYRQHRWIPINVPYKTYQHSLKITNEHLYILDMSNPGENVYVADKEGLVKTVPVPPGANGVSVEAANSKGNMILQTKVRLPKAKGFDMYGVHSVYDLVLDGKAYNLGEVLKANGLNGNLIGVDSGHFGMNEKGDFFVVAPSADLPHLYVFRRKA